jgi:hypothetical protein
MILQRENPAGGSSTRGMVFLSLVAIQAILALLDHTGAARSWAAASPALFAAYRVLRLATPLSILGLTASLLWQGRHTVERSSTGA